MGVAAGPPGCCAVPDEVEAAAPPAGAEGGLHTSFFFLADARFEVLCAEVVFVGFAAGLAGFVSGAVCELVPWICESWVVDRPDEYTAPVTSGESRAKTPKRKTEARVMLGSHVADTEGSPNLTLQSAPGPAILRDMKM